MHPMRMRLAGDSAKDLGSQRESANWGAGSAAVDSIFPNSVDLLVLYPSSLREEQVPRFILVAKCRRIRGQCSVTHLSLLVEPHKSVNHLPRTINERLCQLLKSPVCV